MDHELHRVSDRTKRLERKLKSERGALLGIHFGRRSPDYVECGQGPVWQLMKLRWKLPGARIPISAWLCRTLISKLARKNSVSHDI